MNKPYEQYKPAKKQVIVPIVVFIAALCLGGGLLLIAKCLGGNQEQTTLVAPTTKTLFLEETGGYTIYLATDMTFEGEKYSLDEAYDGLQAKVEQNGKEIALLPVESSYEYGKEGNKSKDVYTFSIEQPGEYSFEFSLDEAGPQNAVVLVGKTQEHVGAILAIVLVACMILLMGTCQLAGYGIYNGINYGIYCYKKRQEL